MTPAIRRFQARIALIVASYPVVLAAQTPTRILYVDDSSNCVNDSRCTTAPCSGCPCGGSWATAFQKL